ncbi:MAG: uroporphyrinogen-III C-methyltransferase [Actinomycetota bacterium]
MTVYLVGAGPGDPGLLTVRGAEVLSQADVVVYDRLSVEALLDLAPAAAERISVGKSPGSVTMPQTDINALLVERGRAGETVVRLKGGDPFVFARGGEEAAALDEAGVPFEVVPGITSAIAVPAYAGIPVTLRHSSTSFTVVTGHEDPAVGDDGTVDWRAVAQVGGTIVILMGVARIGAIAEQLMAGGRSPDTPVAAVQWGTRPEQQTTRATLATIADQPLAAPSVIVVGEVAAVDLAWFERRPLFGKRVIVTRTRQQASQLAASLRELGAEPIEVPVIEIAAPVDGGAALRAAAKSLSSYDWVVVASPNGAGRLLAAIEEVGLDARSFGSAKVAAIGPGTASTLASNGLRADLVPRPYVAEALLEALGRPAEGASRILIARAEVGRDVLPDGLRARGWDVDVVHAYRTVAAKITDVQRTAVRDADIITFTSSSTVERFLEAFGAAAVPPVVACVGPVTAATARDHGLHVDIEADVHTIDGLVAALVQWSAAHTDPHIDPKPQPDPRQ